MSALERAIQNIALRHYEAEKKAQKIKDELLKNESYKKIENTLGGLEFEKARREVYGLNTVEIDGQIKQATDKKNQLLATLGYTIMDLEPKYFCKACNDTGTVNNKRCVCLENERKRLELIDNPDISSVPKALKSIDFSIYGEQESLYKKCARFLKDKLTDWTSNLSFYILLGETGIGKTYLAKTALRECLEDGDDILFINSIKLNKLFLEYHLAPLEEKNDIIAKVYKTNTIVIDDLGVEPIFNNVTLPYLYELIIERMGKKTIITTNLTPRDLENRYEQRIFSRLIDKENSAVINLTGRDLRIKI